ncbi:MAG: right-handed parallel beta-helix repeat-containing protein [Paludibacter sp.]|nr:right-handed parallel beta-helix repeat-containing protein [Paludibacter sp.]
MNISKLKQLILLGLLFFSFSGFAKTYYVSPVGTSSGVGSLADPLTFSSAVGKSLTGGDSIILRGGMYNYTSPVSITKSGNADTKLVITAYPGEDPVIDFRNETYGSSYPGIKLSGSYIHFKGITIQGAGDNGMIVTGSYNHIENCSFRWNCDSGLQMKTGSNNLIENCDSYENFDYMTGGTSSPDYGGNADGFADKQYTNTGINTYKGCRSWKNSDDAWDSYEKVGNTVYDSCWCFLNAPDSYDMTDHIRFKKDSVSWFSQFKNASGRYVITNYGNGNGFKLGGNYTANNATLHNCVSVANPVKGFDQNNNSGIMTLYNCIGYMNAPNYGFSNSSYGTLIVKNSASLSSMGSNKFSCKSVTQSNNTWNTGFSCSASDFESLDYTQLQNERQSNGNLPEINLLHLVSTSNLIDKGVDVGYSFSGSAPDLGAFEYGLSTAVKNIIENNYKIYYSTALKSLVFDETVETIYIYNLSGRLIYNSRVGAKRLNLPEDMSSNSLCLVCAIYNSGENYTKKILTR